MVARRLHHQRARRAETRLGLIHLDVGSASALTECLVGPARRGEQAIHTVRNLVDRLPISIIALDVEIATTAARLRAAHRAIRLPDALVIATAIEQSADHLITTDRKWPSAKASRYKGVITQL